MATGPLWSVPGHSPELRRHPIQLAGYPRAALPRKAAAPQDPSREASCLPPLLLRPPGWTSGTKSPTSLSVPVCRMGRHGGTSASCSYPGQPSLLTLAGGPAECGRQRPLTPSSPPSCPGSAPGTQHDNETQAPEPRAAYDVQQTRRLSLSTLRPSRLAYSSRHSRRARARQSRLLPQCALRYTRSAFLRRRRARKLGFSKGACAKRGMPCGLRRRQAV